MINENLNCVIKEYINYSINVKEELERSNNIFTLAEIPLTFCSKMKDLIKLIIPVHYSVTNGCVVDYKGKRSKDFDIIIFNRKILPPLFNFVDQKAFPITGVIKILDIIPKLTEDNLSIISEKILELNKFDFIRRRDVDNKIYYHIFSIYGNTRCEDVRFTNRGYNNVETKVSTLYKVTKDKTLVEPVIQDMKDFLIDVFRDLDDRSSRKYRYHFNSWINL